MATLFIIIGWVIITLLFLSELTYLIALFVLWVLIAIFNLTLPTTLLILILVLIHKLL